MNIYDNFWWFQPGQFGSKLAKDVCHDLIYSIGLPFHIKKIYMFLHSGYRKKRLDPNAESDTSDAESELAYELFGDYLSGVTSMHFQNLWIQNDSSLHIWFWIAHRFPQA